MINDVVIDAILSLLMKDLYQTSLTVNAKHSVTVSHSSEHRLRSIHKVK